MKTLKKALISVIFTLGCIFPLLAQDTAPVMWWDFSTIENRTTIERQSGIADTLEGFFQPAEGIKGNGLRLDGFTTSLIHTNRNMPVPGDAFTVEAWVSLAEYPFNWSPVLTTESGDAKKGYRLLIGPHGQVSLQVAINEQWVSCTSNELVLPLREWMHIVGVYRADTDLQVFVNGELTASIPINGDVSYVNSNQARVLIGMVAQPGKPSDIHREHGTVNEYYGLSGIIDEIKVYDQAMTANEILSEFSGYEMKEADIEAHKLPVLKNHPGRFGAFYTKLNYFDAWDNLWPVDQDPDVVVCFDKSSVKLKFWRGVRYGGSWVTENENWWTDQSVELWDHGEADAEGCFEHMQDKQCRFSHVRVVENNDARVVVHWRYAPVSANKNLRVVEPKTGWELWIDEYFYIYPDASAIRKVSWKKGTLGYPRQFQESLPILQAGQVPSDLVQIDHVHVANYDGDIHPVSYVENPREQDHDFARDYTIQQYNYKSENKPFIFFEPGNRMSLRWNNIARYHDHHGCNHFPVGMARCDGRTSLMSDRPSHFDGFPISYPVLNQRGDREFWNGLYGMNDMTMEELVEFGRSWAFAPELKVIGSGFVSNGYDKSERCYHLENADKTANSLEFRLEASDQSPLINPAFFIKNWNSNGATVLVNGAPIEDSRVGINHELHGSDLAVFLFLETKDPAVITIAP